MEENNKPQLISKEDFLSIMDSELNDENSYLAGWYPNKIIEGKGIGSIRPWTKEGRKHHNFTHDFYAALVWLKLWKLKRFENTAWNLDENIISKISQHLKTLINVAIDEIDEIEEVLVDKDNRRDLTKGDVKDFLVNYDPQIVAKYTATDYLFQNITNRKIKNVLDFGSGLGRQAMQWDTGVNLFSIDAIQSLYLLQNRIYSILFPDRLIEYCANKEAFSNIDLSEDKNNIYHMPTWNMDLIPDNSMDLIICVQVLNEIDEKTVRFAVNQFKRIARKDCVLYVRDHENYTPALKTRVGKILLEHGFECVYRYQGLASDMEGVPRVWSNSDYKSSLKNRVKRTIDYPNTYGDFLPKAIIKSIYYKLRDIGLPI